MAYENPVKVSHSIEPTTGMNQMLLTYHSRYAAQAINDTVCQAIQDGVRAHLLGDPEFRARITEAIQAAAATLPLEAITKAVKDALAK